ncbi:MAG TPA: DUF2934 domain-containing protein [Acidobacteriota bacterium]|nr:DUF2934 domain-containing protein [Acidobacteriota bacterium]
MVTEIRRNNWARFCRKFNAGNQYRQATVNLGQKSKGEVEINRDAPLMGIAIGRKGRLIDSIDVFTGRYDPENVTQPAVSVREPVKVMLETTPDGTDNRLSVESKDGTRASIILSGESSPQRYRNFVEKVAYTLSERRGFVPGNDVDDWCEAENRVREAQLQFTG